MDFQRPTILFIFSGLPGSGKSTLAKQLAASKNATYLRIDTIEQGLKDLCDLDVEGEGYRLSYRVATENLQLGISVVADSCNPIQLTRDEWQDVAIQANADFVNIEVVCSDVDAHRKRVEGRGTDVDGLRLPTWQDIQERQYDPWSVDRLVIDTARKSGDECLDQLMSLLGSRNAK